MKQARFQEVLFQWCSDHLNFYRVHLSWFTVLPLVSSAIFYASNGEHKYSYIDSLFLCTSALCTCGLASASLQVATPWQQAILFMLSCNGSIPAISFVTLLIRLRFFHEKFRDVAEYTRAARNANDISQPRLPAIRKVDNDRDIQAAIEKLRNHEQAALDRGDASESALAGVRFDEEQQVPSPPPSLIESNLSLPQPSRQQAIRTPRPELRLSTKHTGYGGFTNPARLVLEAAHVHVVLPIRDYIYRHSQRRASLQQHRADTHGAAFPRTGTQTVGTKVHPAPYISFHATVGRNSHFKKLDTSQQEELGGVEYRALRLLWKIVLGYWIAFQFLAAAVVAPYLSTSHFEDRFAGTQTGATWYSFFNVWSGFSNTGLSLLDSSMTQFNATYLYVLIMAVLILAGNTAYPVFLRLIIWTASKLVPSHSRSKETLNFLLDHPRRCFLYLFPSYQTWFLVFVLVLLNCCDWFCFLILDVDRDAYGGIPLNIRVLDGFFQAIAVRSAGFNIVSLSESAPALQVLYVIMMYIAVYPIALSIRSTNVYEEQTMGVYEDGNDTDKEDARPTPARTYIAHHARKQLAFDVWWLLFALWLICIIERAEIRNPATDQWFNVFTVLFEVTSAYACVGLSLGSPVTGISLVGSFATLSKLILVPVMIRGRHRGLPNAIDRAVLLPSDLKIVENQTSDGEDPRVSESSGSRAGRAWPSPGITQQRPLSATDLLQGSSPEKAASTASNSTDERHLHQSITR